MTLALSTGPLALEFGTKEHRREGVMIGIIM